MCIPPSVGFLWPSDQPEAEAFTWHTTFKTDQHPCPRWKSNSQTQQASGRRPTPYNTRQLIVANKRGETKQSNVTRSSQHLPHKRDLLLSRAREYCSVNRIEQPIWAVLGVTVQISSWCLTFSSIPFDSLPEWCTSTFQTGAADSSEVSIRNFCPKNEGRTLSSMLV
jgi:hypothetical protein